MPKSWPALRTLASVLGGALALGSVAAAQTPSSVWTIPGTVNAGGLNNTRFVSDLAVTNPGSVPTQATISFVPANGTTPKQVTLNAGQTVVYRNVFDSLWGAQGAGATRIASDSPLLIRARTYNTAASGTYGVALPVFADDRLLARGKAADSLWISQSADGSSGYRTNVAVVFPDAGGGTATVTVYDTAGNEIGSQDFSLDAAGFQQFGVGGFAGAVSVARAEVQVTRGRAAGYSVVVDNITGTVRSSRSRSFPRAIRTSSRTAWRGPTGGTTPSSARTGVSTTRPTRMRRCWSPSTPRVPRTLRPSRARSPLGPDRSSTSPTCWAFSSSSRWFGGRAAVRDRCAGGNPLPDEQRRPSRRQARHVRRSAEAHAASLVPDVGGRRGRGDRDSTGRDFPNERGLRSGSRRCRLRAHAEERGGRDRRDGDRLARDVRLGAAERPGPLPGGGDSGRCHAAGKGHVRERRRLRLFDRQRFGRPGGHSHHAVARGHSVRGHDRASGRIGSIRRRPPDAEGGGGRPLRSRVGRARAPGGCGRGSLRLGLRLDAVPAPAREARASRLSRERPRSRSRSPRFSSFARATPLPRWASRASRSPSGRTPARSPRWGAVWIRQWGRSRCRSRRPAPRPRPSVRTRRAALS
jgi:hypothetical protein